MKKFSFKLLFLYLSFILLSTICKVNAHEVVESVMERLQCSRNEAIHFIGVVEGFISEIQNNISKIASHSTSDSIKEDLIDQTIANFFLKPSSWVQVTSLNRSAVRTYQIDNYLERLAKLSKNNYTEVELIFAPDYLALGKIFYYEDDIYGNAYEFNVSMWQIFRAKFGDSIVYQDATLKTYGFIFFKSNKSNNWKLRVKCIAAKETVTLQELENRIKKTWILE